MKLPWNKKEPVVDFFSVIPEIAKVEPIVPATRFRPDLLINATKHYAEQKKNPDFGTTTFKSVARCPGIYNYVRHGWIQTAWQDIVIETNGDGETYTWTTPLSQSTMGQGGKLAGETVAFHSKEAYSDFMGGIPNSLSCALKINSPWRCHVPDGYYLMSGPVPYSNETRFTTATGFLSTEDIAHTPLHVQMHWHVLNGKTLIKAGTPLAHYMLVPKKQLDFVVREATEEDIKNEYMVEAILQRRFVADLKERKCMFSKLFKGD